MSFNGPMSYDMYQYSATPANFYPSQQAAKIPVEYTSTSLDEKNRRRRRSTASKESEKETIPNMHLVSLNAPFYVGIYANYVAAKASAKSSFAACLS